MVSNVGLDASVTWNKGDARRTPKGTPLEGVYTESYAVFPLIKNDARGLSESISECTDRLKPSQSFIANLKAEGGRAELFIGWFFSQNGGDTLPAELLIDAGSLGLDLSFDVYPDNRAGGQ